jgi:hypothetical protein
MQHRIPPPQLDTLEDYRRRFADAAYWRPYVEIVCARHRLAPCATVRCHNPGTCPTFIVDERWVVKFFGMLFNGADAYRAEVDANQLICADADARASIPAPALVHVGNLMDEGTAWRWPYLIFEYVPGVVSLGEVNEQVSLGDKLATARRLARVARRLHGLPLEGATYLRPIWDTYAAMLQRQRPGSQARQREWLILPACLVDQIDAFLPPIGELVDTTAQPCLLHGDITGDHVLGAVERDHWSMRALIDFGDALAGDPVYELIPLHLDCFRCDKRLLRAFVDEYGFGQAARQMLPHKALSLALLHPFNVFANVPHHAPQASAAPTLQAFARALFDVDA